MSGTPIEVTVVYTETKTIEFEVDRDELARWLAEKHPELLGAPIPIPVWREYMAAVVAPSYMRMLGDRITGLYVNGVELPPARPVAVPRLAGSPTIP